MVGRKRSPAKKASVPKMDPTSFGDEVASLVRRWYEKNRESWIGRHMPGADRWGAHADEFILALIAAVDEAREVVGKRLDKSKKN